MVATESARIRWLTGRFGRGGVLRSRPLVTGDSAAASRRARPRPESALFGLLITEGRPRLTRQSWLLAYPPICTDGLAIAVPPVMVPIWLIWVGALKPVKAG
jgi:hypothetical protein